LREDELNALDLLWILMLWVVIGLFVAMAIGRASDLGRGSDKEDVMTTQSRLDAALEAPPQRRTNRKRSAGSRNKNVADTYKGAVKEKQRKRAA